MNGALPLAALALALAVVGASLFFGQSIASGAGEPGAYTLGVGERHQTLDAESYSFDAADRLGMSDVPAVNTELLSQATYRQANEAEMAPVVRLAAVDLGDPATMKAAARIGVLNPPDDVKLRAIDTSGEGWKTGMASGYDVDSSSTLTRSGRAFDDDCVTVAVPEGQEELLGHPVIIVYEDKVVVATVTDTGGFAKYGRVLDLGGGVFKALGHGDIWDWGVREVHYKFL
ncbi:MAG: hypothetical protein IJ131_10175 [Eggerthellaceae bacterium]|nr:hypothetical protein [Eggerthellaceae bacterium]